MIDSAAARRRFSRAAATYAGASRLEAEIGARLLERLEYVKIQPRRVLDAGCGTGRERDALAGRYPQAELWLQDFALPMLRRVAPAAGILGRLTGARSALAVCADLERLPLAPQRFDLVFSNMVLHWAKEPLGALREVRRVLGAGGLFLFSTLGPDTLSELRAAAGAMRVHAFSDMHDVGDALLAAGFSGPVMDRERVTLVYADGTALLRDLRASGQTCSLASRRRGLSGRQFRARLDAGLASQTRDGQLSVTYEIVYGHAWRPALADGAASQAVVRFQRRAMR